MGVFDKKPVPGTIKNGGIPHASVKNPPYKDTVRTIFKNVLNYTFYCATLCLSGDFTLPGLCAITFSSKQPRLLAFPLSLRLASHNR